MALRRARSYTFRPTTCCDSQDTTNGPLGGMRALSNLVPNPATDKSFVCRPAAVQKTAFGSFTDPIFISGLLIVGDVAYGMISTARNAGKDEPFAYNLATGAFYTILGVTNANTPSSPSNQGDWTPPILAQVGSRIIVTHPGFAGGTPGYYFGWLDISNFSASITGNTTSGSPTLSGRFSITGIQPGLLLSGTGITAGTFVRSAANFVLSESGTTHSNTTLDGLASVAGLAIGQNVAGSGIPVGTTITAVGASSVTLSQAATASATVTVTFSGATITMSANATGSNSQETITLTGGSPTQPLWGAGNTNINPLVAVPVGVAEMAGSAFFCVNGPTSVGVQISDPLLPCQITNATQALTFNNGIPVVAIGPLGLSTLLGGIVQSLIAFQGVSVLQQITGSPATNNLAVSQLNVPTGTKAPLSLEPLGGGLSFVSPEGLRIISSTGQVSDPIGDHGQGIAVPFIYATNPSRICSSANADALRITVHNSTVLSNQMQEWHYDLTRRIWTGPHSFPFSQIGTWGSTFVGVPAQQTTTPGTIWGSFTWGAALWGVGIGNLAGLWQSDAVPGPTSVFVENGAQMNWVAQTSLMPDNQAMAENALIESSVFLALPKNFDVSIEAIDDAGKTLDQIKVLGIGGSTTAWGNFTWGAALWGSGPLPLYQQRMAWHKPLVFKQASALISGLSDGRVALGNLYMHVEQLGYMLQRTP